MLQRIQPIAICDKFISFLPIQLKTERLRESAGIAFYLFVYFSKLTE